MQIEASTSARPAAGSSNADQTVRWANRNQLTQVLPPDWKYEMRREAQEILPNLLIGPYQSSRDLKYMQGLGLTHVLCIADAREAHLLKARFPEVFQYKVLEIRDAADQNLIRIFPEAKEYIDTALKEGGRVLVHCGDGISRSPAIVTAYVMTTHHMSHEEAFGYVQARRFCVSPNQGFQHQIEAYQHIHEASLQSAQDPMMNTRDASVRRKRAESDDEDEQGKDGSLAQTMETDMDMSGFDRPRRIRNVHQRMDPEVTDSTMST